VLECGHYQLIQLEGIPERAKTWFREQQLDSNFGENSCLGGELEIETKEKKKYVSPTLVLPFWSDTSSRKIFQTKAGLTCREEFNISFKSHSSLLELVKAKMHSEEKPKKEKWIMGQTVDENCECSDVVYSAKCKMCEANKENCCYIGETGRQLKDRIKEHCKRIDQGKDPPVVNSALGEHSLSKHGSQPSPDSWMFSILHVNPRTQYRKTLEAVEIYKKKPSLNRDAGVNFVIGDIMF
jgi:hypothetical protein